jgi:hypothetical protein
MIFGSSGSGKSSLLRSGVLPWLAHPGVIEGVNSWRMALLRPADHAGDLIDGLASSLTAPKALHELLVDGTTVEELARMLREEPKVIIGIEGPLPSGGGEREQRTLIGNPRSDLRSDWINGGFTLERAGQESLQHYFIP